MEEYTLGVMMRVICNHLETQANNLLCKHDLTLPQMLILNYLVTHPNKDISQKELETRFHLKHSTISGLLQRLEKKKMILRFNSSSDGRLKFSEPTDKAKKMYENLKDFMKEQDAKMISICSEEEIESLNRILMKLTDNCLLSKTMHHD